jgi:general secretion pathway protein D
VSAAAKIGVALVAFAAWTAAAKGQDTKPADSFVFTIQGEGMPLETLLAAAEAETGKTFVYSDATALKGKTVKMLGTVRVPKARAFGFFQAVLVSQGYALVPLGDEKKGLYMLENVESARTLKQRAPFVHVDNLADYRNEVGKVIMTTVPLRYANVLQIKSAVSQLLANRNAELVQEIQTANSIMVLGFAPTVYSVKQVIDAMDVPQTAVDLVFDLVELKHAVADELRPILVDLIAPPTQGGARRAPAVNPETGIAGAEKPEPKLITDSRTNSLVLYAVQSDIDEIKRLVAALDVEVVDADNPIRVFMLKNTDAADMEQTLREVLEQGNNSRGSRPSGVRAGGQGPTSMGDRGQEVSIVADVNNNALLITASKTRYAEIEPIIRQLDRRRPQVLVQAAIAELSDNDLRNVGVELTGIQGGDKDFMFGGATGFGMSSVVNATTGTGGTGTGGTGTSTGGGGVGTAGAGFGNLVRVPFLTSTTGGAGTIDVQGGIFGVFDKGFNVPILVQLLKTRTQSNLISIPSVLTNDNEGSRIEAGRKIGTASIQNTLGGAQNTTFGGYQEAKIELIITPHISNDNYLRLEVELLVEAFVGTRISAQIPPDKTRRKLLGNVTVANGRTLVVGGLIQDNDTEVERAVPFLSDIPLLGELFKRTSTTIEKTTLYVFVTPTIMEGFKKLEEVSYEKKLEVERLEGQVRLIDPNFKTRTLEDTDLTIREIEDSGALEVPRYAPSAPADGGMDRR